MTVSVVNLTRRKNVSISMLRSAARSAGRHIKLAMPLSIVLVGEVRMAKLNRKFLGHSGPTDVITFGHGEIVICPAVAARQARAYRSSVKAELLRYVIHGVLHLKGYDDASDAGYRRMKLMEEEILRKL
jgi:probable rRNA maturation factor